MQRRRSAAARPSGDANAVTIELRNQQPTELTRSSSAVARARNVHMQLNPVAVGIGMLVVERVGVDPWREVKVSFLDVDDHEQLVRVSPKRDSGAGSSGIQ